MNISSAKYGVDDKGNNHCIVVVVDGVTKFVPLANDNSDYIEIMAKVAAGELTSVQAQIDTHEAVCAERWKETILRIKRIEHIMIGTAGTTIILLLGIIING